MNHNYFYVIKTHHVANGRDYSDFDAIYPSYEDAVDAIRRNCMDLSEGGYNDWITLWCGAYGCYCGMELEEIYRWNKRTNRYERIEFKDETN